MNLDNLNFVLSKRRVILPKQKDGLFPEMEYLTFLEVTAGTDLWYGLIKSDNM